MKQFISALVLFSLAGAGLGVAGCGGDDDDDNGDPTGGTSTGGNEPSSNGGEGATGGADNSGNVACDPAENTVCQNDTDCPAVASGQARMAAEVCGTGKCLGEDSQCSIDCIREAVDMTPECADCYGGVVACTAAKCLGECVNAPESDTCKGCQVEKGCRDAFNTCSGLPQ